jgi:hypothetical protein
MNSPPSESRPSGGGQHAAHVEQRLEVPSVGAVAQRPHLGPAGGHIDAVEAGGELAAGIATLRGDEVDLEETRRARVRGPTR